MSPENKERLIELRREKAIKKWGILPPYWERVGEKVDKDVNARKVEKLIKEFLELQGFICDKTNSRGTFQTAKTYTDVLGRVRKVGVDRWQKSTDTKGKADLSLQIHGVRIECEIKFGKDKQSEDQKKYQQKVEQDGGIYVIIKDFDHFIEWFDENEPKFFELKNIKKSLGL